MAYTRQAAAAETVPGGETPHCQGHWGHFSITLSSLYQEGLPLQTLRKQENILNKNTLFSSCHPFLYKSFTHPLWDVFWRQIYNLMIFSNMIHGLPKDFHFPHTSLSAAHGHPSHQKRARPYTIQQTTVSFPTTGSTCGLSFPAMTHCKNPRMVPSPQCIRDALLLTSHAL